MPRYVQHISGQGEKWEVTGDDGIVAIVWHCYDRDIPLALPKSEYREVPPPEVWKDVTAECEFKEDNVYHGTQRLFLGVAGDICTGYRLRKVLVNIIEGDLSVRRDHAWAFIIEKREE